MIKNINLECVLTFPLKVYEKSQNSNDDSDYDGSKICF